MQAKVQWSELVNACPLVIIPLSPATSVCPQAACEQLQCHHNRVQHMAQRALVDDRAFFDDDLDTGVRAPPRPDSADGRLCTTYSVIDGLGNLPRWYKAGGDWMVIGNVLKHAKILFWVR